MTDQVETYRLVGVRDDGCRHVLGLRLSLEDANYLREVLVAKGIFASAGIFVEILIEAQVQPQHFSGFESRDPAGAD